jgi:hypothetical protein
MSGHPNQPYMDEVEDLFPTYRHSKPVDEIPTHHQMRFIERVNEGILKQIVMSLRVPPISKSDYVTTPLREVFEWVNSTLYTITRHLVGVKPSWK